MKHSLGGPAIVLALVLAETSVGGLAVLWLSPAWGRVKNGFFKLIGGVLTATAILAWAAARAPLLNGSDVTTAGRVGEGLLGVFAAVCVLWQVVLWLGGRTASRIVGIVAVPVGAAALIGLAMDPAASQTAPVPAFPLLAG